MNPAGNATARPDPYGAMLRGGTIPAAVVGAVVVVVFALVQGALGAAGAGLAAVVVLLSTVSTLLILRKMAGLDPRIVLMGALVAYFFKVMLLGVVLIAFRDATWLSPIAFAISAVVVSLTSTTGEVVAFTRVKTFVYDEPAAAPGPRP